MHRGVLVLAGVAIVLLAARPGGPEASSPADPTRLSAANRAALDALVATSPAVLDPAHVEHDVGGHDLWGPVPEPPLDPATSAALGAEWAAAVEAAAALGGPRQAEAAGYQKAAAEIPGIGAHYVNWALVDAPFDPARPAMLLYDESTLRATRLAGFSYWVRSVGAPPEGFAGPADHWHMHHGLCLDDGMLVDEDLTDPAACRGDWLAGTDLWMAHAWVNPDVANPWGRFAPRNPAVCPADVEPVPDVNRCPRTRPSDPAPMSTLDANAVWCTIASRPDQEVASSRRARRASSRRVTRPASSSASTASTSVMRSPMANGFTT